MKWYNYCGHALFIIPCLIFMGHVVFKMNYEEFLHTLVAIGFVVWFVTSLVLMVKR
jgi:hypothetical protein